jgi:hypothetical protein
VATTYLVRRPITQRRVYWKPGTQIPSATFLGYRNHVLLEKQAHVLKLVDGSHPADDTVPNAPTTLIATPSATSVSIAFTAGSAGGSYPIINYEYSVNGGAWTLFSPADVATPVVVSGLTAETEYSIRLRAVNLIGPSAASAPVVTTTTA